MRIACIIAIFLFTGFSFRPSISIYMIGDSTMAPKQNSKRPETGWGERLALYFDHNIIIHNHAVNGRSTRSFLFENRWQPILDVLKKGDYVIIQFGHNDESPEKKDRYTPPEDFKRNLIRFVEDARSRRAVPILCTPVMRRRFDEQGVFYDTHGEYPQLVKDVAQAYHVPLLDLHTRTEAMLKRLGPDQSQSIFLWLKPGEHINYPNGIEDNTHFNAAGADSVARLAASCMRDIHLPLRRHLRN